MCLEGNDKYPLTNCYCSAQRQGFSATYVQCLRVALICPKVASVEPVVTLPEQQLAIVLSGAGVLQQAACGALAPRAMSIFGAEKHIIYYRW